MDSQAQHIGGSKQIQMIPSIKGVKHNPYIYIVSSEQALYFVKNKNYALNKDT